MCVWTLRPLVHTEFGIVISKGVHLIHMNHIQIKK